MACRLLLPTADYLFHPRRHYFSFQLLRKRSAPHFFQGRNIGVDDLMLTHRYLQGCAANFAQYGEATVLALRQRFDLRPSRSIETDDYS